MAATTDLVDERYYQVAKQGSLAERLVVKARDVIYADFFRLTRPVRQDSVLDFGVSDVVGEAANVLERKYPYLNRVTAIGLGTASEFQRAFPQVAYQQIPPGGPLPFPDGSFAVGTSNAVLEHVGSHAAQEAFVAELARVARTVFISVPYRFFPIEHHTGIPFLHWSDTSFGVACKILDKDEWTDSANLILMTRSRLKQLARISALVERRVTIGTTGIQLGPFSSNLYMLIETD